MAKQVQTEQEAKFPEVLIFKSVEALLKIVREDYENSTPENSMLWNMFGDAKVGDFVFFDQAVSLFTRKPAKDRRTIEVSMGYNLRRVAIPTIHILLPSETPDPAPIGGNEGYEDDYLNDNNVGKHLGTFTYGSNFNYNLLITSDNTWEVVLIANLLKMGFMSLHAHFEIMGFKNLTFGGNDLQFDDDLVPPNVFHRNFSMTFTFDTSVRDIVPERFGTNFIIAEVTRTFSLDSTTSTKASTGTLSKPVLSILSATGSAVNLSITDTNDLTRTGFKLYRGLTPSTLVKIAELDALELTYSDTTIEVGTVYFYAVDVYIASPYETRRSTWVSTLPLDAFGSATLNGGDVITDEVPTGGFYDISVLNTNDVAVGAVEIEGLVRVQSHLNNDFTMLIDADDPSLITLTASGDSADVYLWMYEDDDGIMETIGEGSTINTHIYSWGSWDITLITVDYTTGASGKVTKIDVNNFVGNEHLFLPLDYLRQTDSFPWDFLSGTIKLKSKYNQQPYSVQMIRDENTVDGLAGDLLQVGWTVQNVLDVAAILAWESDLTKCTVYRIYAHDTGVDTSGQATLIEPAQSNRFKVGINGENGLPYFYNPTVPVANVYDFESGINSMYSSGSQSMFFGFIAKFGTIFRNIAMVTQNSRGLFSTSSDFIRSSPNNNAELYLRQQSGNFYSTLCAIYADMFDVDQINVGQSLKARVNDVLVIAEDDGRTYDLNAGAMDALLTNPQHTSDHQMYAWFAARGAGQGIFDAFEKSWRRYINWRFGKNHVMDRADSWSFGALLFNGLTSANGTFHIFTDSEILLTEFTFSFWFMFEDAPVGWAGGFFGTFDNANDSAIGFSSATTFFAQFQSGTTSFTVPEMVVGEIYHVVVKRNSSNEVYLTLNNVSYPANVLVRSDVFEFGRIGSKGTTSYLTRCGLGDVAVWNRAITDAEITSLYTSGPSSTNSPSPLLSLAPNPILFYRLTGYNTKYIVDEGSLGQDKDLRDFGFYAHEWR